MSGTSIAAGYYESTGELDKAIDAYRLGIANYPRDWGFHNNLSENLHRPGAIRRGTQGGPGSGSVAAERGTALSAAHWTPTCAWIGSTRPRKSLRECGCRASTARGSTSASSKWPTSRAIRLPSPGKLSGTQASRRSTSASACRRPIGMFLASVGSPSKLYKRAAETALRRGLRDVAAGFEEADARADALSGNCRTVRRLGRPALALAMCGDAAQAEKLAAETSKRFPNGTIWNAVQLPEIRAAIELQRDQPAKAVELLASASPYERAYPEVGVPAWLGVSASA